LVVHRGYFSRKNIPVAEDDAVFLVGVVNMEGADNFEGQSRGSGFGSGDFDLFEVGAVESEFDAFIPKMECGIGHLEYLSDEAVAGIGFEDVFLVGVAGAKVADNFLGEDSRRKQTPCEKDKCFFHKWMDFGSINLPPGEGFEAKNTALNARLKNKWLLGYNFF